jgi:hypothetical protein
MGQINIWRPLDRSIVRIEFFYPEPIKINSKRLDSSLQRDRKTINETNSLLGILPKEKRSQLAINEDDLFEASTIL